MLNGQPDFEGPGLDTIPGQGDASNLPDTTIIDFFRLGDVQERKAFSDTLLSRYSHQYDPLRKSSDIYSNLGNLGSAHYPLSFELNNRYGIQYGYNQYEKYNLRKDSFLLSQVNKPFTEVSFVPLGGQENFAITTNFSRNFKNNVNVSIDYQRIKWEGLYSNQATRSTHVGFGVWYHHPNDKHDLFFTIVSNSNNEEFNGGVSDKTLFEGGFFNFRMTIPVILSNATTRHTERNYDLDYFHYFINNEDGDWTMSFQNTLGIEAGKFRTSDEDLLTDDEYNLYGDFITDDRGLRNYFSFKTFKQHAYIILKKEKGISIKTGIEYQNHRLDNESSSFSRNQLFGSFETKLPITNRIEFSGLAKIGLLDYAGDLYLDGKLDLSLGSLGNITGQLLFNRHRPNLLQEELFISDIELWQNEFAKPIETAISGRYYNEALGFGLKVTQMLIDQPIYFDDRAFPVQLNGTFNLSKIEIQENLEWGILHFYNKFLYQTASDPIFPLPDWYSTHSIFIESLIFKKKMLLKTGFDARVFDSFLVPRFMPITGQFYVQQDNPENYFVIGDFFINFKIDSFRTFIKLENFTDFFTNRIFYLADNHPQYDYKVRFGVSWQLID